MGKCFLSSVLTSLLTLLAVPLTAFADGGVFIDYEKSVYIPSQKAAIAWDESAGEETLILSTQIKVGDVITHQSFADLAWIIPVPSKTEPEVEAGDIGIFYDLAELFAGEKASPGLGVLQRGDGEGVTVIAVKEIDIFDVTILQATEASALVDWLNDNGYLTPESAVSVLEEYCEQEDFFFIANKIDLTNKYLDLTITEDDRVCAQAVSESVYSYLEITPAIVDYLMADLTSCEDAAPEAVQTLVELDRGVATPLKITFSPETPFYPLKISSINEGETIVDVYVFSDAPVQDQAQSLTVLYMSEYTPGFGTDYGFDQDYVTYLSYSGELGLLGADAQFEPCEYDKDADPNHVSLGGKIVSVLSVILSFVLYIVYPVASFAIFGFAIVGFIVVLKAVIKWFGRLRKGRNSRKSRG